MRKIGDSYRETFEEFELYLENIYEIFNKLHNVLGDNIEIIVDDYRLDNIEEFKDIKFSNFQKLSIKDKFSRISFDYNKGKISLFRANQEQLIESSFVLIKEVILKSRTKTFLFRRKALKVFNSISPLILGGIAGWKSFRLEVMLPIIILMLLRILYFLNYYNRGYGYIKNVYKSSKGTFISRNKDSLIISTVSMIVGTGLGMFLQYILFSN